MGSTVSATSSNQGENEGLRMFLATCIFGAHRSSAIMALRRRGLSNRSGQVREYQVEARYMISRLTNGHRDVYYKSCSVRKESAWINASAARQGGGQLRSASGSEEEV